MAIEIRTRDLPAKSRHDAWREFVCDTLGPLDLRIDPDAPLRGEVALGQLGPVGVGRVRTSTPHSVHRTAGLIHRDNPELYRAVLAVSGSPLLRQDGRETRLARGEFAIYDFTRPYDLAYDAAVQLAVFSFPHDLLPLSPDDIAALRAVPISPESGAGALAAPLLRRVAQDADDYRPDSAARLATVVMDLVTTALAERVEQVRSVPEDVARRTLLLRVRAFIEQHLGRPDLDPGAVAAAHHVSVRYLHRLFESENTTVAAWIRQRRLERCRADLLGQGQLSVSEVCARWGLPDSAHFSRLFKHAYGMPPAEFRRVRGTSNGLAR